MMVNYELIQKHKEALVGLLNKVHEQINEINKIKDSNPNLYANIQQKTENLDDKLKKIIGDFLDNIYNNIENQDKWNDNLMKVKDDVRQAIEEVKPTFKEYPSVWYGINPVARTILGILSIITVAPALAITRTHGISGFNAIFFKKPDHDPNETLDQLERTIVGTHKSMADPNSTIDRCFVNNFIWKIRDLDTNQEGPSSDNASRLSKK